MLSLDQVMEAIQEEINYQNAKWGEDKEQSLPGYILVMQKELTEARDGWCENRTGRDSALSELLQVVAVGVRALQTYGTTGWAVATNDIPMFDNVQGESFPEMGNEKLMTLTNKDGATVYVSKSIFLNCYQDITSGLTTVVTRNGSVFVKETVGEVQAKLQN